MYLATGEPRGCGAAFPLDSTFRHLKSLEFGYEFISSTLHHSPGLFTKVKAVKRFWDVLC